jgi:hypothetical protein
MSAVAAQETPARLTVPLFHMLWWPWPPYMAHGHRCMCPSGAGAAAPSHTWCGERPRRCQRSGCNTAPCSMELCACCAGCDSVVMGCRPSCFWHACCPATVQLPVSLGRLRRCMIIRQRSRFAFVRVGRQHEAFQSTATCAVRCSCMMQRWLLAVYCCTVFLGCRCWRARGTRCVARHPVRTHTTREHRTAPAMPCASCLVAS